MYVTKTRGGFNKWEKFFEATCFFFESFGSSCFNAQALSVFAIGLPTIYVNVLKQDWNQLLQDLTLMSGPVERVIGFCIQDAASLTTQDGYNLEMTSHYPSYYRLLLIHLQRSGWFRFVELSQFTARFTHTHTHTYLLLGPGGLTQQGIALNWYGFPMLQKQHFSECSQREHFFQQVRMRNLSEHTLYLNLCKKPWDRNGRENMRITLLKDALISSKCYITRGASYLWKLLAWSLWMKHWL